MQTFTFVALCAIGAEKITGNELKHLGYTIVPRNTPGRVTFKAGEEAVYTANFCLRTSDRVYIQMVSYQAKNFDELFEGCYNVEWQDYLKKDTHVYVDKVRINNSKLNSEHSVQSVIHKAIYKKLGSVWKMTTLPESGAKCDIRIFLDNNTVSILLDTSGEALHKRGYRTKSMIAPLRETTAAVLLHKMLWRRKTALHDPFCGSGTIAIEATLFAHNIPPGLGRNFAYENLAIYDKEKALEIKKNLASQINTSGECRITGSDIDYQAVDLARINAEHACVAAGRALQLIGSDAKIERPEFIVSDFKNLQAPYESGLLLCNPPYGERIGDIQQAEELYSQMSSLFEDFKGWNMGIITSHKTFEQNIGKRASSKEYLKAGNLDTVLYKY